MVQNFGVEFIYGSRWNKDSSSGSTGLLQALFYYDLSSFKILGRLKRLLQFNCIFFKTHLRTLTLR